MSAPARVQIVRTDSGWFFRVVAVNGRTLCHSETYTRRAKCEHAAGLIGGTLVYSPGVYVDERTQVRAGVEVAG